MKKRKKLDSGLQNYNPAQTKIKSIEVESLNDTNIFQRLSALFQILTASTIFYFRYSDTQKNNSFDCFHFYIMYLWYKEKNKTS